MGRNDSLEVRGCNAGDEAANADGPDPYGYARKEDERFEGDMAGERDPVDGPP